MNDFILDATVGREQNLWQTLVIIGIFFVFFYFILWRPEQKKRKKLEQQRQGMKVGDRVTAMGIIGTVARIQEHTVIVKMVDGAKVEFIKGAITDVHSSEGVAVETVSSCCSKKEE
ncbi:MAG: preprotein translocase subunit YajC [Simkaniaceae bacterium]|nr:preprotein translocase subunit YajC [Simkaniaceae bacterium]